jgi:hypothetical protein
MIHVNFFQLGTACQAVPAFIFKIAPSDSRDTEA